MDQVITRLKGGLGNQMFQYAAGMALASRWKVPLFLDRSYLDDRPEDMTWTPRSFELGVFQAPYEFASDEVVRQFRRELDERPMRIAHRLAPSIFQGKCFVQPGTGFDPGFLTLRAPIYLEGFWQNEAYFKGIAAELRELFSPKEALTGRNKDLLDQIRGTRSASIHVRRGDYVTVPEANRFHGLCSPDYYARAAALLVEQAGVDHFFLFSDDPEWTQEHIKLPRPATYVAHNTGQSSHWDLYLMKHCAHHIIANSSFSWWGAWLNPSTSKHVVAPAEWFQGSPIPTEDILPSSWTAL